MRIKFPYEPTEACITYKTEEIGTFRKKKKKNYKAIKQK